MELPIENFRVKQVIDFTTNGNELEFSTQIGISQPRINRLFHKNENGNYPMVTLPIIKSIANKYKNISLDWLVLGNGTMLRDYDEPKKNIITGNNNIQQNNNKNSIFLPLLSKEDNAKFENLKDTKILHLEEKIAYLKKVITTQEKLIDSLEKK